MNAFRTRIVRVASLGLLGLLPNTAFGAPAAEAPPENSANAQPSEANSDPAAPVPENDAETPEPESEEADEKEHAEEKPEFHQAHVDMPSFNGTTPWIRFTTFVDYFGDNYDTQTANDDFVAVVNYLNFGTDTRRDKYSFSTMARVDTQTLINTKSQPLCDISGDGVVDDTEANLCAYDDTYRLERLSLGLDTKYFRMAVGDVNVNFGRGLGLSVRKELDIGNDPTIKGGMVEFRTKPVQIKGVAGVGNRQQSDYSTRRLFNDPGYKHALCDSTPGLARDKYGNRLWTSCSDLIAGGRIDTKLPAKIRLGAHYNFLWFGAKSGDQFEAIHSVGGDFARAAIAKRWDFFAGATGLMRNYHQRENYPELQEDGIAVYTANNIRVGKSTSLLVEGKYYDNYVVARDTDVLTVQYAKIPTLERIDQQVPAGANTAGGRVRLDHTFREKNLTVYANMLAYAFAIINEKSMFSKEEGSMLYHGFVGFRWNNDEKGVSLKGDAGYRWEGYNASPGTYPDPEDLSVDLVSPRYQRKLPQVRLFYNQVVGHGRGLTHSLAFNVDWRYEETFKANNFNDWHRGNVILGYGMAPFLAVSFIGGFSSEFPGVTNEPSLQNKDCPGGGDNCLRKPHLWPGVEIRYNFLTNSNIRLFAGRQVGGLLCVNGSCRVLPDFEGARVDLVFGF